jgi:hypothetical protein
MLVFEHALNLLMACAVRTGDSSCPQGRPVPLLLRARAVVVRLTWQHCGCKAGGSILAATH